MSSLAGQRLISRAVWLGAMALLLSGCSLFSWIPGIGGGKKKDVAKPAELVKFDAEVRLQRIWRSGIGDGLGKKYLRLTPTVVADRVIAADGYGLVQAHDRFTGKRLWRTYVHKLGKGFFDRFDIVDRRDPSFLAGGVGSGDGLVMLGTTFGEVIALNVGDGEERWRTELESEVLSIPAAGDDAVFAQTIDGRLVALSQSDGSLLWSYDNQLPILTLRGTSSPIVSDEVVYAGFANGKVIALRTSNGEPIWEHRVMLPEGRSELERIVDVDARPLVSGGVVYAAAYQGRVKGLSRRDGRARWEFEASSYLDMAEGLGQLYVIDDLDVVTAIDQLTGEVNWQQESFTRRKLSPPIAFSNYVVFGDDDGYLHVIAQRDGRLLGRRKLDGDGIRSAMVQADGTLFVLGNSGSLQALQIELK